MKELQLFSQKLGAQLMKLASSEARFVTRRTCPSAQNRTRRWWSLGRSQEFPPKKDGTGVARIGLPRIVPLWSSGNPSRRLTRRLIEPSRSVRTPRRCQFVSVWLGNDGTEHRVSKTRTENRHEYPTCYACYRVY